MFSGAQPCREALRLTPKELFKTSVVPDHKSMAGYQSSKKDNGPESQNMMDITCDHSLATRSFSSSGIGSEWAELTERSAAGNAVPKSLVVGSGEVWMSVQWMLWLVWRAQIVES